MTDLNLISEPTEEELSQVARDLNFEKTRNDNPQSLSLLQINQYNELGYLMPLRGLPADEINEVRIFFDQVLKETLAAGNSSYSISTAHLKFGNIYDLMSHPAIIEPVKDLLGEDLVAWGAHFFCKMPNDGKRVPWHQDCPYWPLTPTRTATVWLAIDDADVENSCMRFIAGSHRHGHIDYRQSDKAENNLFNQTALDAEHYGECVDVEMRAGEISIHSDLLLHSSEANHSDRRRCGLTLRYCAMDVRALSGFGWAEEGVVIRGKDASGHWGNPPRPS